jgi:hypothetical protein
MVDLINWGLFVVGMLSGMAITMVLYAVIWDQMKSEDKKVRLRKRNEG